MNQQFDNQIKLNGSVQFFVYDENNELVNNFKKSNQIKVKGINAYRQILGFMDHPTQPNAHSIQDDYQINLQSNANDFLSQNGKTPFLQPIKTYHKKDMQLKYAFRYKNGYDDYNKIVGKDGQYSSNISNANDHNFVKNKNAFLKNSDDNVTQFITNGNHMEVDNNIIYFNNGEKWMYIYGFNDLEYEESSQSSDNSSSIKQFQKLYHSGLRIDIRGPQFETFHMQLAYDFDGNLLQLIENGEDLQCIPPPIFPCLNGKPINRQFTGFQGGAITNDAIHSYYYDLYPRCCKIPKYIIFLFQHSCNTVNNFDDTHFNNFPNFDTTNIQIDKIQFFSHTLPKCGPISIYFNGDSQNDIYNAKINQTLIKQNSVCYYASIGYNQAIGKNFNKIGLANSTENYKFIPQKSVNDDYNTNEQQTLSGEVPITTGQYFYRIRKALPNECDNILTLANTQNWQFEKTSKNRIDIIYKINVRFGDQV